MNLKLKKSIVLCLICTMLLGMMGMETSAAGITYVYDDVGSMYNLVNNFRQSGQGWYYNQSGQTVEGQQLQPLAYDYNLEKIAMIRAAELVQSFSHTRPNGQASTSMVMSLGMSCGGENIAQGTGSLGTADSIFTAWREENENYNGQGHRRNMLSVDAPFTSIGIGHVRANGTDYWVHIFGSGSGGGSREDLNGTGSAPSDPETPAEPETPTQPETPQYPVLEGSNAVWSKDSGSAMVMRIDADYSKFTGITINGVDIDPGYYDSWSGSTVISLKPEFLSALAEGQYTCRVNYNDGGYADVSFTVNATAGTPGDTTGSPDNTDSTQNGASGSQTNTNGTSNTTSASQYAVKSPQTGEHTASSTACMIVMFLMLTSIGCAAVRQMSAKKIH